MPLSNNAAEAPRAVRVQSALRFWLGPAGMLLAGLFIALSAISHSFAYGSDMAGRPIVALVELLMAGGAVYLAVVWVARRTPYSRGCFAWVIAVGVAMRLALFTSAPILEDDFYRYLWDGAVTAAGFSPYTWAPDDITEEEPGRSVPAELRELAAESGLVIDRVNHPHLRTIYPPVAQAAFALAHLLGPWSLLAWRIVLLGVDAAVLCLLLAIIRRLGLSPLCVVTYWWNPLVVKEVFNSGHMDVIVLPFVLAAVLLAIRRNTISASVLLAFAVGAKVWPVILLPVIVRPLFSDLRRLAVAVGLFAVVAGAMVLPLCLGGDSGAVAYARRWEMNDALFMVFQWSSNFLTGLIGAGGSAQLVARCAVLILLAVWIAWLIRRPERDGNELCERCLLALAALFLLSPIQFPWYYVWMVPLLAVRPRMSLLMLTPMLALYYLRFYFKAHGAKALFDNYIVWLEYAPVWGLLIWEWRSTRARRPAPAAEPA